MAPRAMATGTISCGLVSIPVKLDSTTVTGSKIGLNWINPETGSRVRMRDGRDHRQKRRQAIPQGGTAQGFCQGTYQENSRLR